MSSTPPSVSIPSLPQAGFTSPPQDSSFGGGGYDANNVILAGENNKIENSRRCSIIQGASNLIEGKYNTHIIGDFLTPSEDNKLYIGCRNGMWVGGKLEAFGIMSSSIESSGNIIAAANIEAGGDVIAFSSSDERLKDNIQPIKNPLSKVLSLDGVEFDWNDNQKVFKGHDIGLIAQQVKSIAPELVTTRSDGYLAMKYDKLTSLLVGAIKEQQDQIEILKNRVEYLLEKVKSMN